MTDKLVNGWRILNVLQIFKETFSPFGLRKKWCEYRFTKYKGDLSGVSKTDKCKFKFTSTDHNNSYDTNDNKEFDNNNR